MGRGAWKRGQIAQSAQAWGTGYTNAGPALTAGVQNTPVDPTALAIAAQDRLVSGFNQAVTSGQWANNLRRAGKAGWQKGMTNFANMGLAAKATTGMPHYQAFAQQYGPAIMGQVQQLPPRGSFAQNQQRSQQLNTWANQQRGKFKGAWRGGA
jgi:hypothetical protein